MNNNFNNLDEEMRLLTEKMRNSRDDAPWLICQERYEEYISSIKAIRDSLNTRRVSISIEQEGQNMSIGNIILRGKEITPTNSQKFAEALSMASNVHIYPRIDGIIECDITYYGLTRRV